MAQPTRWVSETKEGHSQWYIDRFRRMAAEGDDLAGEARLVDAMVPRAARVLDAGCGTGRVSAELHARGHVVVGVDADPELIEAAKTDHPGPTFLVADLSEFEPAKSGTVGSGAVESDVVTADLAATGEPELFDAAVLAGNVIVFVAPGTETEVLRRMGKCVKRDGFVIVGFHVNRHLALRDFDLYVADAGLRIEHRFATWDLKAWHDDADFAVTVLRHP